MIERRRRTSGRGGRAVEEPAAATADAGLAAGASVVTAPGWLRVGDGYAATLTVTGYPAEVGPWWLEPLLSWPGRLDVALHIDPVPGVTAASRLRRQRARLESARRIDADRGRLDDPLVDAAAEDAAGLAGRLARGEARLFRVGLHLTVHAPDREELAQAVADVRTAAAAVLLDTAPATWRQLAGWTSTLPLGHDGLGMRRVFDTDALAAAFPLASADLPAALPGEPDAAGVLYGVNTASNGIVWWDRWAQDNHNSVVLARSGAGKSYLVKLEVLRQLYDGVQVAVIDPEDEYTRLADAVGGTTIRLGAHGVRLNPLDLPPAATGRDGLTRRALFLHTLVGVLLGQQPPPAERAALDRAILTTYAAAGITNDPSTWHRPAPLLRDLVDTLTRLGAAGDASDVSTAPDPAAATLAARLSPWTHGSFRDLFDGPTTSHPHGHLVVWSTRELPDELRAVGMLMALDAIWQDVDQPPPPSDLTASRSANGRTVRSGHGSTSPAPSGRRRLVVVDEAWTLMREGDGARFLARMAKAARKRRAGLTVITQDAADLLGSDLGQVVVANAATQILLRQAPQAIDAIASTFGLTGGEARMLVTAGRGEALLLAGSHRVGFQAVASPAEHELAAGWADLSDPDFEVDLAEDDLDSYIDEDAGDLLDD